MDQAKLRRTGIERLKRESPKGLSATAIHEAGHAVIGRVLKQLCGDAAIVPNKAEKTACHRVTTNPYETLGYWWDYLDRYRGDEMKSIMVGRIMTYMAGREAEEELLGSCAGGDGDDQWQIALTLRSLLPRDESVTVGGVSTWCGRMRFWNATTRACGDIHGRS